MTGILVVEQDGSFSVVSPSSLEGAKVLGESEETRALRERLARAAAERLEAARRRDAKASACAAFRRVRCLFVSATLLVFSSRGGNPDPFIEFAR